MSTSNAIKVTKWIFKTHRAQSNFIFTCYQIRIQVAPMHVNVLENTEVLVDYFIFFIFINLQNILFTHFAIAMQITDASVVERNFAIRKKH